MKILILISLFALASCQQKDSQLIQDPAKQPGKSLPSPVPAANITSGMAPSSGA